MIQKIAEYKKINQDLEFEEAAAIAKSFSQSVEKKISEYPKYDRGILYRTIGKPDLKMGWDNDDFTRNLVTFAIDQRMLVHRVPRILNRIYNSHRTPRAANRSGSRLKKSNR